MFKKVHGRRLGSLSTIFRLAEPSAPQYRGRGRASYPIIARLDAIYQRRGDERRRGQRTAIKLLPTKSARQEVESYLKVQGYSL